MESIVFRCLSVEHVAAALRKATPEVRRQALLEFEKMVSGQAAGEAPCRSELHPLSARPRLPLSKEDEAAIYRAAEIAWREQARLWAELFEPLRRWWPSADVFNPNPY